LPFECGDPRVQFGIAACRYSCFANLLASLACGSQSHPEQGIASESFSMPRRLFDIELSAEPCLQPATIMRIWSASAVARYYLDPAIKFLRAGNHGTGKPAAAGYYIVPHCSPDCCRAFGGVSLGDLGPFPTRTKARRWSRTYLTEPGETSH
jgi:hypothetical protein